MERVMVADVAQIYALWKKYCDAVNAGDLERWIVLWSNDAIQMPPDAPSRYGKEQIQIAVQAQFDLFETKIEINPEEVYVFGKQAYSHGLFSSVAISKEGGATTETSGKFLAILEKQVKGSWKILIDCFNYNRQEG